MGWVGARAAACGWWERYALQSLAKPSAWLVRSYIDLNDA
jgi:hypothetical protein